MKAGTNEKAHLQPNGLFQIFSLAIIVVERVLVQSLQHQRSQGREV